MQFDNVRVSDVKIEMGKLVKRMRARHDLTQDELAKRLSLSRITIQHVERGSNVTMDTLLLILQHFDEIHSFRDFIRTKMDEYEEVKSLY